MSAGGESPILIDIWTVDEARREELLQRTAAAVRDVLEKQPGFVSSEIFQSIDGRTVVLIVRMRTALDRQRLMDLPEARETYRQTRAIANTHANAYRLVKSFGEGAS